jgi:hypothetical protein
MQKAESNIGTEQRLDVCILKKKLGRCRTFSRGACRRSTEGLIDTWAGFLCVMNLHAAGR